MKIEECKICKQKTSFLMQKKIMNKYDVKYFQCDNCGFIQTENPFWLSEAYESSFNYSDTGTAYRPILNAAMMQSLIPLISNKKGKFLDYAGGYGLFARIMRDMGFDFYTYDKYSPNLLSRGFDYTELTNATFDCVTIFECFEHFDEPLKEIEKVFSLSENIFVSTTLIPKNKSEIPEWYYLGLDHGQHIAFYTKITMKIIAEKFGYNYYGFFGYFHLFTKKKSNNIISKLFLIFGYFKYKFFIHTFGLKPKFTSDLIKLRDSKKTINVDDLPGL